MTDQQKIDLAIYLNENMANRSALRKKGFIVENEVWAQGKFLRYTGYIPDPAHPTEPLAQISYDGTIIIK